MRRRLAVPFAVAAGLAAAAPAAHAQSTAPGGTTAPARPPLSAKLVQCTTGPDASDRAASFTGSMPQIAHGARMWMRFDLFERTPQLRRWAHVAVPVWARWERSQAGVPGFIYTKRVEGLDGPAAYRVRVRFRWYSVHGRLLRATQRTTRGCRQPDPRPDLHAGRLTGTDGPQPGTAVYQLVVLNRGLGPAGPFDTTLAVGSQAPLTQRIAGIDAGMREIVGFTAQRCAPGSSVRVVLDARDEVLEADEGDDAVTRDCPFTS
ncbi:MAG TPA: CARDB domain-containing protein [Solirubrobacteraceae bacterium]|nr:CARDB domain-containing protein [Solirubrobacteraceae bacterium]